MLISAVSMASTASAFESANIRDACPPAEAEERARLLASSGYYLVGWPPDILIYAVSRSICHRNREVIELSRLGMNAGIVTLNQVHKVPNFQYSDSRSPKFNPVGLSMEKFKGPRRSGNFYCRTATYQDVLLMRH